MLFSYFFDIEKTQRIEMEYDVINFVVIDNTNVSLQLKMSIREYENGDLLQEQDVMGNFLYTNANNNFDMEFDRIRMKEKWIFTAINNQKPTQTFSVGLASTSTTGNPLGVDIVNDKGYTVDLKGNTLAILEQTYVPPTI